MKSWTRAKGWVVLAAALGGVSVLTWMGYGGVSWMASTGDMFAQFRLQAAPRIGEILAGRVGRKSVG
jgi:hypothetical protein